MEAEKVKQREAALAERRARFEPIDFEVKDVDLPAQAYNEPKEGRHVMRPRQRPDVSLPPINQSKQYYQGKARERVVAELKEARNAKEHHRQKAKEERTKAIKYSKLVVSVPQGWCEGTRTASTQCVRCEYGCGCRCGCGCGCGRG